MKKAALSFVCASVMMAGLTGCGQDNGTNANMYRGNQANMGNDEGGYTANYPYYGNGAGGKEYYQDNRFSSKNGRMNNARAQYDRGHNKSGNMRGMTGDHRSGMVDENGILNRKTDHAQQRGMNFKKSSSQRTQKSADGQMHYHRDYDGEHVQSLTSDIEKMDGVRGARVIMNENDVVVGYEADGNHKGMDDKIKNHATKAAGEGKNVIVTADEKMYSNMQNMDDRLRSGTAFKEVENTFKDMMTDLGNAAKRPFEKSR